MARRSYGSCAGCHCRHHPPRVIGLDDWAWPKNVHYGTLVVDLERHRPVALLPDRSASSVMRWLQEHPQVDVISRDRAEAFAEAARIGAPHALQIADRWHVVSNLREALEKVLARHRKELKRLSASSQVPAVQPEPDQATTSPAEQPSPFRAPFNSSRVATERAARRERRGGKSRAGPCLGGQRDALHRDCSVPGHAPRNGGDLRTSGHLPGASTVASPPASARSVTSRICYAAGRRGVLMPP